MIGEAKFEGDFPLGYLFSAWEPPWGELYMFSSSSTGFRKAIGFDSRTKAFSKKDTQFLLISSRPSEAFEKVLFLVLRSSKSV